MEAQNGFGYSEASVPVAILCATKPATPLAPVTSVLNDKAIITWFAPADNGTPILGYKIYIRKGDQSYVFDNLVCDGTTSAVVLSGLTNCVIPLSTLTGSPYSLGLGFKIFSYVTAYNAYGESLDSPIGSQGVIVLVPDAPISPKNDPQVTTKSKIGFYWSDGASNGGTDVIDYRITYDKSTGNFEILKTNHLDKFFETTVALISGRTYKFYIEARNTVGYSLPSVVFEILAA